MPGTAEAARQRAKRIYPRSEGFQAAYVKGAVAAEAGRPLSACPYRGTGGWTAWGRAWRRGHRSVSDDD